MILGIPIGMKNLNKRANTLKYYLLDLTLC